MTRAVGNLCGGFSGREPKLPLISLVIPVYNRAGCLSECLGSVERQTLQDWECLIIDDGSTDQSLSVASTFAKRDPRFKAILRSNPTKGAAACRNEGIERARGKYLIFLDSDDLLNATCLETRVGVFSRNPNVDFVVFQTAAFLKFPGDTSIIWNVEKLDSDLLRFLRLDAPWSITGPIWRRASLLKIGGFVESLPGWQDWQLHVDSLLAGLKYFRAEASRPDCFCRIEGGDRISRRAATVEHAKPKAVHVLQLIKSTPRLRSDQQMRNACIGLVWYIVVQLQEKGRALEALAYWRDLKTLRMIGFRMWMEGIFGIILHGRRGGGLAWKFIAGWPKTISQSINRSTFLSSDLAQAS